MVRRSETASWVAPRRAPGLPSIQVAQAAALEGGCTQARGRLEP